MPHTVHHRHTFPPAGLLALPEIPDGVTNHDVANAELAAWVARTALLTRPDEVVWVDGTPEQWNLLVTAFTLEGDVVRLDPGARPGSLLTRSRGARTADEITVADRAARRSLLEDVAESMRGRTMYVVPFASGRADGAGPIGVHITDSPASVAALRAIAEVGADVLDRIGPATQFVRTIHATLRPGRDARGVRLRPGAARRAAGDARSASRLVYDDRTATAWVLGSDDGLGAQRAIEAHTGASGGVACTLVELRSITRPSGVGASVIVAVVDGAETLPATTPRGRRIHLLGVGTLGADPRTGRAEVFGAARGVVVDLTAVTPTSALAEDAERDAVLTDAALTEEGDVWWEGRRGERPVHLIDAQGEYVRSGSDTATVTSPDATAAVRFHAEASRTGLDAIVVTTTGAASIDELTSGLDSPTPPVHTVPDVSGSIGSILDEILDDTAGTETADAVVATAAA